MSEIELSRKWASINEEDDKDIHDPAGNSEEMLVSYLDMEGGHSRVKRGGILSLLGTFYTKIGPKYYLACLVPSVVSYKICPIATKISKATIKLG